jgi:hypothetical protein
LKLKELEDQTLDRYRTYMKETNQVVADPIGWDLKGYADGAILGLLPWSIAMKQVADTTKPFQEKFLRLKDNATEEKHKIFFGYIYAHEKALEFLALKELSGDQNRLTPVEHLLKA